MDSASARETLRGFAIGKPVVIEETFPLNCPMTEFEEGLLHQLGQKAVPLSGVAAGVDYALVLTTEDGVRVTNTVVLEPDVYSALTRYVEQLGGEASDEDAQEQATRNR